MTTAIAAHRRLADVPRTFGPPAAAALCACGWHSAAAPDPAQLDRAYRGHLDDALALTDAQYRALAGVRPDGMVIASQAWTVRTLTRRGLVQPGTNGLMITETGMQALGAAIAHKRRTIRSAPGGTR